MKLRLLDVPWHIGHQHEMLKFPFVEWSWLGQYRRGVDVAMRGECDSRVTWVPYYEPGKYDAAILHLDQDCVIPYELRARKGVVYRQMNEVIRDIPKIVIMHGAPYSPEALDRDDIIERVKAQVGDNYMVVNSHRAAEEWGWGKVIIHGMSANEWFDLPKEPRVVTVLSPRGMPAYYDRPFLADVRTALAGRDIMHCHIGVEWKVLLIERNQVKPNVGSTWFFVGFGLRRGDNQISFREF